MSQRIEVERTITTELARDQYEIPERWGRTARLHSAFSGFLESSGELIPAKKLLTGKGFDSYVHRILSFSSITPSGKSIRVTLRALEPSGDHNVIVNLSDREEALLLSPVRLDEREPPTMKDLVLLEFQFQILRRILTGKSKRSSR